MKANPDKFGTKTISHNFTFYLKGNKITCEENVNLLGITIDSQLNLDQHLLENCEKASQQLNIFKG